jgi:RES domain-containing protein
MHVFRVSKKQHCGDLSGEGARLLGGRWNRQGTGVVYTSENRALATVEYLVHLPLSSLPVETCIAEIEIPDDVDYEQLNVADLPSDWARYPAPHRLKEIGEHWIQRNATLLLRVPSAVVLGEWNVLINPNHPLFTTIRVAGIAAFEIDERLLRTQEDAT